MLLEYVQFALQKAKYEILPDDSSYYGSVRGFPGVYANASSLEKCRDELRETLDEWIVLRLRKNLKIPVLQGINLNIRKAA